jgi:hypothetical protein
MTPAIGTTPLSLASASGTAPNWSAIGRWILILTVIIMVGAIAISGANRD